MLEEIEELLDTYVQLVIDYTNSHTISPATYIRQGIDMFNAKQDLLNKIQDLISNQK